MSDARDLGAVLATDFTSSETRKRCVVQRRAAGVSRIVLFIVRGQFAHRRLIFWDRPSVESDQPAEDKLLNEVVAEKRSIAC